MIILILYVQYFVDKMASSYLKTFFEKEKLNEHNFMDWFRSLRILLRMESKDYVLEEPIDELASDANEEERNAWEQHTKDSREVTGIMLSAMIPSLQKQFEGFEAYDILTQLKELFHKQAKLERFETQVSIIETKLEKGKPVSPHVLKMIGLFERMDRLGYKIPEETCIDLLLYSLHDGYKQFRLHYNMSDQNKSLHEMHAMLKTAELDMIDSGKSDVMLVHNKRKFKRSGKAHGKGIDTGKGKVVAPTLAKPKKGATQE